MRSPLLNLSYWSVLCNDLFGKESEILRKKNLLTIGRENKKGKVLYVNSIEDPWAGVSVLPLNKP
jgi:hypothetical protein